MIALFFFCAARKIIYSKVPRATKGKINYANGMRLNGKFIIIQNFSLSKYQN